MAEYSMTLFLGRLEGRVLIPDMGHMTHQIIILANNNNTAKVQLYENNVFYRGYLEED